MARRRKARWLKRVLQGQCSEVKDGDQRESQSRMATESEIDDDNINLKKTDDKEVFRCYRTRNLYPQYAMQPVLGCNVATQPIYRRNLHPDETDLAITLRQRPKNLRAHSMRQRRKSLGRCNLSLLG